jgi:N-acetyl-anhydromuramyl-L-alanine amidase AmpD
LLRASSRQARRLSYWIVPDLAGITSVQASGDYGPAIWRPVCSGKWYTSGYGHKFVVCHDMEGYYWSSIAYIQRCDVSVSIHYCVNGLQDTGTDAPAGEVSQLVSEAYYAWHAKCWNQYSYGTEHEGFVSNPAWFTDAMYNASGLLQRHLCDAHGIAKDRNHIVG